MKINISTRKFTLTEALSSYAKKRINFALANKSEHIHRINMRLSDINGPKGGSDKRCHLLISLNGLPDVVIEDVQTDIYTAIDFACDRASRTVVRKIGRKQSHKRQLNPFVFNEQTSEVLA
ncbi:MAG: HPF/RaiA family ribosome-associated protein [Gammaproteobacteria bacterium]|nr:HPF/RaiA family ribosome-associated protein [Gammaproteobacteria bacterium]